MSSRLIRSGFHKSIYEPISSFMMVSSSVVSRIPTRTMPLLSRNLPIHTRQRLSSSFSSTTTNLKEVDDDSEDDTDPHYGKSNQQSAAVSSIEADLEHQRIWRPDKLTADPLYWSKNIVQSSHSDPDSLISLLDRIEKQELEGGRMRSKKNGVLHEDPAVDMRLLIENYTVNSLASALRDREEMLQMASQLAADNDFETLKEFLHDCHPDVVLEKRQRLRRLSLQKKLNRSSLETIRKGLMRMPRQVTMAHSKRAGVVVAIVHVDGVPSILLEKRARHMRAHPDEVCLPGGMVCKNADRSIVETCLREMKEEIGGFDFEHNGVSVLGILRCNWGEVHHLVGVAVTPVVCSFNQDLAELELTPNPDEVAEVFTIPLASLMDKKLWVYKDDHAPIFVGGPYAIWGLTGYILDRFVKDILTPFSSRHYEILA